jgi:hypothetical protein
MLLEGLKTNTVSNETSHLSYLHISFYLQTLETLDLGSCFTKKRKYCAPVIDLLNDRVSVYYSIIYLSYYSTSYIDTHYVRYKYGINQ